MPNGNVTKIEMLYWVCPNCDYECMPSSVRLEKMLERCHKKKCKHTGRTKQPECIKSQANKIKVLEASTRSNCSNGNARSMLASDGKGGMAKSRREDDIKCRELWKEMLEYKHPIEGGAPAPKK